MIHKIDEFLNEISDSPEVNGKKSWVCSIRNTLNSYKQVNIEGDKLKNYCYCGILDLD